MTCIVLTSVLIMLTCPIVLCVDHTELQWRRWTVLDLAVMIAVGMQHKMSSPSVFVLLFKYFDPVHTHLWLVNSY